MKWRASVYLVESGLGPARIGVATDPLSRFHQKATRSRVGERLSMGSARQLSAVRADRERMWGLPNLVGGVGGGWSDVVVEGLHEDRRVE
jgi:hypothetical protein